MNISPVNVHRLHAAECSARDAIVAASLRRARLAAMGFRMLKSFCTSDILLAAIVQAKVLRLGRPTKAFGVICEYKCSISVARWVGVYAMRSIRIKD